MKKFRLPSGVSREEVRRALEKEYRSNNKKKNIPKRVAAATIAILSGRRRGEIAALRRENIDFKRRVITRTILKKKQNHTVTLPAGPLLLRYLRTWRVLQGRPKEGYVVPGNPRTRSNEFHKWAKKHGWNIRFHDLRHLFAIHLVEIRTPIALIRKALQHSSIDVTSIYLELHAEDLRDIMPRQGKFSFYMASFYMGRKKKKRDYVYLGKRVPDTGKPGLDSVREVLSIVRAIMLDYRLGRIPKKLARRRLSILKLAVMRDRDFQDPEKRQKALGYIDRALAELRRPKRG